MSHCLILMKIPAEVHNVQVAAIHQIHREVTNHVKQMRFMSMGYVRVLDVALSFV